MSSFANLRPNVNLNNSMQLNNNNNNNDRNNNPNETAAVEINSLNPTLYRAGIVDRPLPSQDNNQLLWGLSSSSANLDNNNLFNNKKKIEPTLSTNNNNSSAIIESVSTNYSVYSFPIQLDSSSSFYSSSDISTLMNTLQSLFESLKIDYLNYEGEAKLSGLTYIAGEPIIFSLKIFDSEENCIHGKYIVEIQRRSGNIALFTQFYSKIYVELKRYGIINRSYTGVAQPTVLDDMQPPSLNGENELELDNYVCNLLFDMTNSNKLTTIVDSLHVLNSIPIQSIIKQTETNTEQLFSTLEHSLMKNHYQIQRYSVNLLSNLIQSSSIHCKLLFESNHCISLERLIEILNDETNSENNPNENTNGELLYLRASKRIIAKLFVYLLQNESSLFSEFFNNFKTKNKKNLDLIGILEKNSKNSDLQLQESVQTLLQVIS